MAPESQRDSFPNHLCSLLPASQLEALSHFPSLIMQFVVMIVNFQSTADHCSYHICLGCSWNICCQDEKVILLYLANENDGSQELFKKESSLDISEDLQQKVMNPCYEIMGIFFSNASKESGKWDSFQVSSAKSTRSVANAFEHWSHELIEKPLPSGLK